MWGGVGGGFDSHAQGLYPYLGKKLKLEEISSLRIRFRNSRNIEESVYDVIVGIEFLKSNNIKNRTFGPLSWWCSCNSSS